jgi:hypothetical protein
MKKKQNLLKNVQKIGTDRQTEIIFLLVICLFSVNLFGQNRLLKPASTLFNLTRENVTTYTCPTFDVAQMLAEDAQDEELSGKPYRFGQVYLRYKSS